jgi:6-pyruvoyltetrahydropterin/6-carboxytetrahydropterin synthase
MGGSIIEGRPAHLREEDEAAVIEFTGTAVASFSASHMVEGHLRCGRLHGHRWRIEVSIKAGQDPATGELVGLPELATAVEQLCAEVDREDINAMFPGGPATPAGVALAVRERLSLRWRTIEVVRVWMDDVAVAVYV